MYLSNANKIIQNFAYLLFQVDSLESLYVQT